jgi:hypothetical protein
MRYRNVLWKGSTREMWALDGEGELDEDLYFVASEGSGAVFKNIVFPSACANSTEFSDVMRRVGAKTVYETYLGVPRAILCYRWTAGVPAHQRIVFSPQAGAGSKITWDQPRVDALRRDASLSLDKVKAQYVESEQR